MAAHKLRCQGFCLPLQVFSPLYSQNSINDLSSILRAKLCSSFNTYYFENTFKIQRTIDNCHGAPHSPPGVSGCFVFSDSYFQPQGGSGLRRLHSLTSSQLFKRLRWLFTHPATSRGGAQPLAVTKAAATPSRPCKGRGGRFLEGLPEPSPF